MYNSHFPNFLFSLFVSVFRDFSWACVWADMYVVTLRRKVNQIAFN